MFSMIQLDREALLKLNDSMRETIEELDCNNPLEICVFATSMVTMGNHINMEIIKQLSKK